MNYGRTLTASFWLVFHKKKYLEAGVRMTIKKPTVGPGEVPINLTIELPASLFDTPQFKVKVQIPDTVPADANINIADGIAAALKEAMPAGVTLTFETPKTEGNGE